MQRNGGRFQPLSVVPELALVTLVIGMQSGDEGKGRIVDYLAEDATMVIRYQGGDNAGHTVVNDHGEFKLHMVPSGIFRDGTVCIVGPGCVANPDGIDKELKELADAGIDTSGFVIDQRAHVVMPWHIEIDKASELTGGLGTTKRGIGQAYMSKARRKGALRWADLMSMRDPERWAADNIGDINAWLRSVNSEKFYTAAEFTTYVRWCQERFTGLVRNTQPEVREALAQKSAKILLEGQLGVMRDVDQGTYPFVTSSSPHLGGVTGGAGIPATRVGQRLGVAKGYMTKVGAGPFPTLDTSEEGGKKLAQIGQEIGATTKRLRDCGWLDLVVLDHAAYLNDLTEIALTKIDVLDQFPVIKVCVGYRLSDGTELYEIPASAEVYDQCTPIYQEFEGWMAPTSHCRTWDELPQQARAFIEFIEQHVGVPVTMISVGPQRDALILRSSTLEAVA